MSKKMNENQKLVKCINNQGYEASLIKEKKYEVIEDSKADELNMYLIVDESNESYFYSKKLFQDN